MQLKIFLKLLTGFTNNKGGGGMFAAFNATETAGAGQDNLLDDVIHIAHAMGEQRGIFTLQREFNRAFDHHAESVHSEKVDGIQAAHFKTLTLEIDFRDADQVWIEIIRTGIQHRRQHAFHQNAN